MVFQQSVVVLAFITLSFGAETCYDGPGGASPTEGRAGGHNIQVVKCECRNTDCNCNRNCIAVKLRVLTS